MKNKIKYIVLASILSVLLPAKSYAGDMFSYSLFNRALGVVLPHDPQKINTGVNGIDMYVAADRENGIVYTIKSTPTQLEHNIGAYKYSFKETLDQLLTMSATRDNQTVISFDSSFNRNENKYIAEMTTWFVQDGMKRFRSVKRIIHNKKIYDWTVMYSSISEKNNVFDGFKSYVKLN